VSSDVAVSDAVRLLDERYASPIRIAEVAREVGLCADHLTVVFFQVMGRTPQNYLQHVRIERAKALLQQTGNSLADIAIQTGFTDASHLSRTFRGLSGESPGEFRQRIWRSVS